MLLSDKFVKLVLQTTLPVLPAIARLVLKDSCVERLSSAPAPHDELTLVRPTVPLQEDPRALVAQQPQLRSYWRSAAEEIVRGVGGVASPHTTLPVDTPPLVAVKVQSRLSQSSRPADAAPVIVSVAPVSAPIAAKLAAIAAPEAVRVPVDTSPTVVKFPGPRWPPRRCSASCPTRRRWTSAWLR